MCPGRESKTEAVIPFHLVLEVIQCHLHILFVKVVIKAYPDGEGTFRFLVENGSTNLSHV